MSKEFNTIEKQFNSNPTQSNPTTRKISKFPLFQNQENQSTYHVVLLTADLTPELQEANKAKNLQLGRIRDSIPSLRRRGGISREGGAIHLHGPRPGNVVGVNNVTHKSEHSNTSMLHLRLAKESDGGLIALTPEFLIGERQRVEEWDDRVELLGEVTKIGFGLLKGNGAGDLAAGGGSECSG